MNSFMTQPCRPDAGISVTLIPHLQMNGKQAVIKMSGALRGLDAAEFSLEGKSFKAAILKEMLTCMTITWLVA